MGWSKIENIGSSNKWVLTAISKTIHNILICCYFCSMRVLRFLSVICLFALSSCNNDVSTKTPEDAGEAGQAEEMESYESKDFTFTNPGRMYAHLNFIEMFRLFKKMGRYNDMIKFTSRQSLNALGEENILNFYRSENTGLSYDILDVKVYEGDTMKLNVSYNRGATTHFHVFEFVSENDTAKILLSSVSVPMLK